MANEDVLYRRTASGVVVLLSLMIGFVAGNPYSETAPMLRIGMFVIVVLLIVGVFPGSFLQGRIQAASQTEAVRRSRLLKFGALMAPVLLAALSAFMVYYGYDTLTFVDNTNIGTIDREEAEFNLIRFWTLGAASVVWLALIAAALFRRKIEGPQTPQS